MGLCFMILDMRSAEIGINKVASHIEDIGVDAVEQGFASISDVIGNALADEAAELTAKLIQPSKGACQEANLIDKEAFLICLRIGFTQARLWESSDGALLYEAPVEFQPEETGVEIELQKATKELTDKGHDLVPEVRGDQRGHCCNRCKKNLKFSNFAKSDSMDMPANHCPATKVEPTIL